MIERINNGDKQALRELLTRYTKPIYDRALFKLDDAQRAKELTRETLSEIVAAAEAGKCPPDVSVWIMGIVDRRCSEQELDELLDEVLSDDPVGWNGSAPMDWKPDSNAWSGDTAQPPADEPAPAQQPVYQPAFEQPSAQQPVYQPAFEQPSAQQPVYQPAFEQPAAQKPAYKPASGAQPPVRQPVYGQQPAPDRGKPAAGRPEGRAAQPEREAAQPRRRSTPDLFDDEDYLEPEKKKKKSKGGSGVGMVLLILLLLLLVGALVWMLVVMLMTRGVLPRADLGFADWFNANIFKLY